MYSESVVKKSHVQVQIRGEGSITRSSTSSGYVIPLNLWKDINCKLFACDEEMLSFYRVHCIKSLDRISTRNPTSGISWKKCYFFAVRVFIVTVIASARHWRYWKVSHVMKYIHRRKYFCCKKLHYLFVLRIIVMLKNTHTITWLIFINVYILFFFVLLESFKT